MTPHKKKELDTMMQLVTEAESIVTNPNTSLDEFGKLLHQSWLLKRSLTQKISNADIDEIYQAGISAGALGGKLLGAGGGGFMLFFVAPGEAGSVAAAAEKVLVRSLQLLQPGQPRCGL